MNLNQLFDLTFITRHDEPALEYGNQTLTFGEVRKRSEHTAAILAGKGLKQGDRLCVYLPNCIEMIDLYLACIRLGVIFVPINILYRDREISHIVEDAEPKAIIRSLEDLEGDTAPVQYPALDGDDPAAIIYTSGTTGVSKGAILTHNNFIANGMNINTCWQITHTDRLLLSLPLFHVHGLGNGLHAWLLAGCRMRLLERFEHKRAAADFLGFRPTLFFGVPTMYIRLLDTPDPQAREIGRFMRLFVSGSAPLPAQVLEEFRLKFGHTILERYGMTETLMNTSNPYLGERRPGSVGFPMPGVSIQVRSPEGEVLPDGQTGELYVRGPNIFAGYWKREEATRAAFSDGYFRTGDIGERSADKYLTLKGRRTDLIISAGFNIYPREIEEFLLEQEGITEAAVVGVADEVRGEVPVAYVVGIFDETSLEQCCRSAFASFKVPRAFIRVEALPRTALGKVQKHLLPHPTKA